MSTDPSSALLTTTTPAPVERTAIRRSGADPSVVTTMVCASSENTFAVGGVRSVESRTTRMGDGPSTMRTVSRGSSAATVPTPTSTASHAARRACETRRSSSPEIHFDSPVVVAMRPSSVCANFTATYGRHPRSRTEPRSDVASTAGRSEPFGSGPDGWR